MSIQKFQTVTLNSADIKRLPLKQGSAYGLIVGTEASDFNAQTVTPKQSDGKNTGTKAQGFLDMPVQPTEGDAMVIGDKTYTFGPLGIKGEGKIEIGASLGATQMNVIHAINGTDGHNSENKFLTAALASFPCIMTARAPGTDGNSIVTTETFTSPSNVFDAATLGSTTAGTDTYASVIALPTPGSADSAGSPQAFADEGMIEFVAILPELLLVPGGAVTSVECFLQELDVHRKKL